MKQFSQADIDKLLELNKEYATASTDRKVEIEQEVIAMAPRVSQTPVIAEIDAMMNEVKSDIAQFQNDIAGMDINTYCERILAIQHKICDHVATLGVELEKANLDGLKALIKK